MITKEQVLEKAKKVLKDIEYDHYFEDTFRVLASTHDAIIGDIYDFDFWEVIVNVEHEQFEGQKGSLILAVKDETLEPIRFNDLSGGRIPTLKISKKENGSYFIDDGPVDTSNM